MIESDLGCSPASYVCDMNSGPRDCQRNAMAVAEDDRHVDNNKNAASFDHSVFAHRFYSYTSRCLLLLLLTNKEVENK